MQTAYPENDSKQRVKSSAEISERRRSLLAKSLNAESAEDTEDQNCHQNCLNEREYAVDDAVYDFAELFQPPKDTHDTQNSQHPELFHRR